MSEYAEEFPIKEYKKVTTSFNRATRCMSLNLTGRFFVSTVTGLINNPETGIPLIFPEKLADVINQHIDDNNWQNLPIEQIANILAKEIDDLNKKQKLNLRELKLSLVSNIIDDDDDGAEVALSNAPGKVKPLILA